MQDTAKIKHLRMIHDCLLSILTQTLSVPFPMYCSAHFNYCVCLCTYNMLVISYISIVYYHNYHSGFIETSFLHLCVLLSDLHVYIWKQWSPGGVLHYSNFHECCPNLSNAMQHGNKFNKMNNHTNDDILFIS